MAGGRETGGRNRWLAQLLGAEERPHRCCGRRAYRSELRKQGAPTAWAQPSGQRKGNGRTYSFCIAKIRAAALQSKQLKSGFYNHMIMIQ